MKKIILIIHYPGILFHKQRELKKISIKVVIKKLIISNKEVSKKNHILTSL